MTYSEYISDKRVVLIAPSATTVGTKQRDFIESFDVVARINWGFPVPAERIEDISDRTDVLYHLLGLGIATLEEEFRRCVSKIKFIVSVHPRGERRTENFIQFNRDRIGFDYVSTAMRENVRRQIKGSPNAGMMAITHLLEQPIHSLHLTGFSFYTAGYYVGYGGKNEREAKAGIIPTGRAGGHDQPTQKAYLRRLFAETSISITMDKKMAELLYGPQQPPELPPRKIPPIVRKKDFVDIKPIPPIVRKKDFIDVKPVISKPVQPTTIRKPTEPIRIIPRDRTNLNPNREDDLRRVKTLNPSVIVQLRVLKAIRRNGAMVIPDDTFLANARDAYQLIDTNIAELA